MQKGSRFSKIILQYKRKFAIIEVGDNQKTAAHTTTGHGMTVVKIVIEHPLIISANDILLLKAKFIN